MTLGTALPLFPIRICAYNGGQRQRRLLPLLSACARRQGLPGRQRRTLPSATNRDFCDRSLYPAQPAEVSRIACLSPGWDLHRRMRLAWRRRIRGCEVIQASARVASMCEQLVTVGADRVYRDFQASRGRRICEPFLSEKVTLSRRGHRQRLASVAALQFAAMGACRRRGVVARIEIYNRPRAKGDIAMAIIRR
jgi:hypothetical protein